MAGLWNVGLLQTSCKLLSQTSYMAGNAQLWS
jgi:hypothetical protein